MRTTSFASKLVTVIQAFAPALLWYALISYASNEPNLPGPALPALQLLWFKTAHILVYGVLGALVWYGWSRVQRERTTGKQNRNVLLTVLVLAAIDEWHQSFVPGRTPRLSDIVIDLIGTGLMLALITRYNHLGQVLKKHFGM